MYIRIFFSFTFEDILVNVIANSTTRYYTCVRSDNALGWLFRRHSTCSRTSKYLRLSIPRVRLIALNQISLANALWVAHIDICIQRHVFACSRFGRKGFYRYEFNFRTNNSLFLSLFLSLSFLFLSTCFSNTRRTERYVPMQTWFAGYLERNKGGELSSTQRHISAGYP